MEKIKDDYFSHSWRIISMYLGSESSSFRIGSEFAINDIEKGLLWTFGCDAFLKNLEEFLMNASDRQLYFETQFENS